MSMRSARSAPARTGGDRACASALQERTVVEMTSPKAPAAAKAAAPARPSDHPPTAATKPPAGGRTASTLRKQVLALANGKTQQEITSACKGVRPNHVGVVIARHKRADRIEARAGKLDAAQQTGLRRAAV